MHLDYLTEDRKTLGLVLDHSIRDNYAMPSLPRLSTWGLVKHRQIDAEAQGYMDELNIKAPSIYTLAGQLSGGNQQKAVVAKWLGARAKVLIFDEPTRGIDINGRREIYRLMEELLREGSGEAWLQVRPALHPAHGTATLEGEMLAVAEERLAGTTPEERRRLQVWAG
ncbi:MAG TPA: ATP-binding cassette domain-containing protein, partial [Anaerolineae bacterium]|nr:ATP-binding cassette domain-containing protein [Anaerolineae bacterium]